VPHWSPAVATIHASGAVHAVTPPSIGKPIVAQQGWPVPPQVAHIPGAPCPTLRPAHPKPELHVPPPMPQQLWPDPPQARQTLPDAEMLQLSPVPHGVIPPVQHGWPSPPHAAQLPPPPSTWPEQEFPLWQVPPPQQAPPAAPQVVHVPADPSPPGRSHPSPALHVALKPLPQQA